MRWRSPRTRWSSTRRSAISGRTSNSVQRVVPPATIEEALQLADRAGFDLTRNGQPLLDWFNYGVLILASLEGKVRSGDEIEKVLEDAIRRKLGAPKDDWLSQNDRPRRRG